MFAEALINLQHGIVNGVNTLDPDYKYLFYGIFGDVYRYAPIQPSKVCVPNDST